MSQGFSATRNPTLLTAVLSVAALAGYVAYRFTLGTADNPVAPPLPDALPAVVLDDLAGTPTALSSFTGRPLLINFWATWCGPCLREIPLLIAFQDEQAGIDVIGIAVDHLDPVLEFADEMQFNYPNLVGQSDGYDAMAALHNDASVMPFSVFVTASGAILGNHAGELHREQLDNFVATIAELEAGHVDLNAARDMLAGLR